MMEQDPYIPVAKVMALAEWSERTVYRRIDDGLLVVRSSAERQGNGRPTVEISVASLPPDAQARYWAQQLAPSPAPAATELNIAEITESCRAEALRRLPIVQQAEDIIASRLAVTARVKALASEHQISPATLYNWLDAYRVKGFPGLIPNHGRTKGRFVSLPDVVQDAIKEWYLSPHRPSPTTVYHRVVELCDHLKLPKPSQGTINRFLRDPKQIPEPARILMREGARAYRAKAEPKVQRDYSDLAVGEIWCGDHREFDVFVQLPDGKIARPWLTAWLDLRSRVCTGWHVDLVPNSDTIALALRAGILRFGVPRELYKDNGKDYRCHYLNGDTKLSRNVALSDSTLLMLNPGVLSRLGVISRNATPYTPWAKAIESWFGHTFPEWEKTLPGWCGRDAKQRPEKLAKELERGELLTLEEFIPRVSDCIEAYHRREHSALQATPLSQWEGVPKEMPDARALDLLLLRHKPAKVFQDGLRLFGFRYWHDELHLHKGHTVGVSFDPQDLGAVVCFDKTGRFLCEAISQTAMSMHPTVADMKATVQRRRLAKQRTVAAANDRKVLWDGEEALRQVIAEREQKKVVNLGPRQPDPSPEGPTVPRLLGTEHAASALATSRASARRIPPQRASRPAAPGAACYPAAGPGLGEEPVSWSDLLDDIPDHRSRLSDREAERSELMREILNG